MFSEDRPLLARYRLVDTRSPEAAREFIGQIFCPHFLLPCAATPKLFHARHHSARQTGYSVNFVAYGAEVEIDPGELSSFFLLQWPLRGSATVRCGSSVAEAAAGTCASILSPTLPTRMTWREGCEKLIILAKRDILQRQLEALTGETARPVEFEPAVAIESHIGRLLERHIMMMVASVEAETPVSEAYQMHLRDGLTALLLTAAKHNQSDRLERSASPSGPHAIRRAEEYIAARLGTPLTMAEVASAAGTNLRSLQSAFKQVRGLTLTQSIQQKRLEELRAALSRADEGSSVAALAHSVGLGHLGRAATAYRLRYGETPRETLRRSIR